MSENHYIRFLFLDIKKEVPIIRFADDASFENEQTSKEGVLVKLTNGSLASTKTALSSSANLHHVEKVYAFLYQGDTTDMTKAKYVLHEDLDWNPKDSSDYKV
ncbi:hypothetical protein, partial [Parabacteroides sp.]